jgi:hypothetical protein
MAETAIVPTVVIPLQQTNRGLDVAPIAAT